MLSLTGLEYGCKWQPKHVAVLYNRNKVCINVVSIHLWLLYFMHKEVCHNWRSGFATRSRDAADAENHNMFNEKRIENLLKQMNTA